LINKKDVELFVDLTMYNIDTLKDGLTPIEYAIKLYKYEECDIISYQLKLIIHELFNKYKFLRSPGFYAYIIKLHEKDENMYDILTKNDYKLIETIIQVKKNDNNKNDNNDNNDNNLMTMSIHELNFKILEYYISIDDVETFYSYIKLYVKKIDTKLIQILYEKNPIKIITEGIKKKYFSLNNIYKIILFSQDLTYFDLIKFDKNIAYNYIEDCVKKCLLRTFYYLFKQDNSILLFQDSNSNTVLHNITTNGNYHDMIKLLITLNSDILFIKNDDGLTPLIYHLKQKNYLIVEVILKNYTKPELFEQTDNQSNTILHLLSTSNSNIKLIKTFIYDNLELLDKVNNSNETAILISTKTNAEDIYFLLKSLNANVTICDDFGNTIYHYICLNSMVLGSVIENKSNIFGYTPEDYCDISLKYYAFID
jgi:ankyrin repeat protein